MASRYASSGSQYAVSRYAAGSPYVKKEAGGEIAPEREAELLGQLAEATGARAPEQDSPGLFRRVVDVLSRPNYAIAGASEELFTERGGGAGAAVKRAGREFFSGIGSLKGDKEGFGQVMEQSGVGEGGSFSDIAPFLYSETGEGLALERGGSFDPTARGTAGLVGDILLDPTTYLSGGAAGAVKFTGKGGTRLLNKVGKEAWQQTQAKYAPEMAKALTLPDDLVRNKALREVRDRAADEFELTITPTMVDKGGLKWAGRTVVPGETIRKLGAGTVAALERVPGGEKTIGVMASAWDKSRAGLNAVFSAFPRLADAPAGIKARAIQLHRNFVDTAGSVSNVLNAEAVDIGKAYDALVKADPNIGRKFYEVREGTGQHVLTAEQQAVYDRTVALHDKMEKHALDTGVLAPEDLLQGGYFHHSYLNTPEDFAAVADAAKRTIPAPSTTAKFQRERPFKTYAEAERISRDMNIYGQQARAAGVNATIYPELKPNYDVMQNLYSYINQFSDAVARKQWADDLVRTWGVEVDPALAKAAYEVATPIPVKPKERWLIDRVLGGFDSVKDMRSGMEKIERVSLRALARMSDDGKREFFREMFTRVNSPSQYADVVNRFQGYDKFFPNPKAAVVQGTVDPHWTWLGEKAAYVQKTGGLYGDKTYMLPAHVADDFENLSAKLLNLREMKPAVRAMLNGYDRFNNTFKTGVYTFWPASASRDIYNNYFQAALDVGFGALARPRETARVLFGDGKVVLNGIEYEAKTLKALAGEYGVVDKSGRSFIQMTGEKQFSPTGRMAKLVAKRAQIENWTRVQFWLNNIHRGLDPRDAADKVRDFLFAYNELNPIEREVFRRAIPFYTFPRKAIALHLRALKESPGRLSAELKPFRGREDENGMLTSWDAQAFKLRLDRDGKTVHTITGIDLPIKTLDTLWRGDLKRTYNGMIGMFSPILKAPVELGTGRRMFDGKPLDRAGAQMLGRGIEWLNPPKAVKNWLGYAKEYDAAGRPKYSIDGEKSYILFQSWALSRVLSTSERQFNQFASDPNWASVFLDLLTGLRYREFNMDEQQTRRYEERIRQLEQSLVERGAMKKFERTFTPKRAPELQ